MVEAMTIILAVGVTRGWRASLTGVFAASIALIVIVGALGASLEQFVPINVLRVVVGVLLLVFGMQWLRKAIMRSVGMQALHDEERIYEEEIAELKEEPLLAGEFDWTGFVVSFKGVFLEGLEVAFIVISFGANSGRLDLAAAGAVAAFVTVSLVGLRVHQPLTRIPENTIKFAVGLMLMSFGTFWGGEGVGLEWSLREPTIFLLVGFYWLTALALIAMLRSRDSRELATAASGGSA